jgi:hypothetical protein
LLLLNEDVGILVLVHVGPDLELKVVDTSKWCPCWIEQNTLEIPAFRVLDLPVWNRRHRTLVLRACGAK